MSVKHMIEKLADRLTGRLNDDIIFDIRDYVDHNEIGVAFNILYNQLYEYDISITHSEWEEIDRIGKLLECDKEGYDWSFVKDLVE